MTKGWPSLSNITITENAQQSGRPKHRGTIKTDERFWEKLKCRSLQKNEAAIGLACNVSSPRIASIQTNSKAGDSLRDLVLHFVQRGLRPTFRGESAYREQIACQLEVVGSPRNARTIQASQRH